MTLPLNYKLTSTTQHDLIMCQQPNSCWVLILKKVLYFGAMCCGEFIFLFVQQILLSTLYVECSLRC